MLLNMIVEDYGQASTHNSSLIMQNTKFQLYKAVGKFDHIFPVSLKFKKKVLSFYVAAVYRPSPSKQNQLCVSSLYQDLEIYALSSRQCIIDGKVNFDLDTLQKSNSKKFLSALDRHAILDQFVEDVTHKKGPMLDVIVSRKCTNRCGINSCGEIST